MTNQTSLEVLESILQITELRNLPCNVGNAGALNELLRDVAGTVRAIMTIERDAAAIPLPDFGYFVELSEDRSTIFACPMMADGSPDREGTEMNWGEVTAPEQDFLDKINELFGTRFQLGQFAGR